MMNPLKSKIYNLLHIFKVKGCPFTKRLKILFFKSSTHILAFVTISKERRKIQWDRVSIGIVAVADSFLLMKWKRKLKKDIHMQLELNQILPRYMKNILRIKFMEKWKLLNLTILLLLKRMAGQHFTSQMSLMTGKWKLLMSSEDNNGFRILLSISISTDYLIKSIPNSCICLFYYLQMEKSSQKEILLLRLIL